MRNRRFSSHDSSFDLSDVNEQELAKVQKESPYRKEQNMGTDLQGGESVPMSFDTNSTEKREQIQTDSPKEAALVLSDVPPPQAGAQCTELFAVPEDNSERKSETEESKEAAKPSTPLSKRRRGSLLAWLCAVFVTLCTLASFALIFLSIPDKEMASEGVGDTQISLESDLQTSNEDTETELEESVYLSAARSTVSIVSKARGGEEKYYTGVAVLEGGYIASVYEAADAESISIVTHDGGTYAASVAGREVSVGLSLLKCDAPLPCVTLCADKGLSVGERVFVIGNLGDTKYASSLLSGEVSYTDRAASLVFSDGISRKVNAIQLSSFGGADTRGCGVFDGDGNAFGLLFFSDRDSGTCLAFDMSSVLELITFLKDGKEAPEDVLCSLAYTPARLCILGEQAQSEGIWGVCVKGFSEGDSDAHLKLREGDVIYRLDDTPVADTDTLSALLEEHRAGDKVEIFVLRNSQKLSFEVTLG